MHPNLSVLKNLNLQDLDACKDVFAENFVWHYINPQLPELDGDYRGVEGLKQFFARLGDTTGDSFREHHVDTRTAGDELVISQVRNCMILGKRTIEVDAVVVWRIVDSKIAEAWDIPATNTIRSTDTK
jgi:ketosteroid isomerase-like protein